MTVVGGREPRELVADVERLLEELDTLPDPFARQTATELIQALVELYGVGLGRIVETIATRDDGELARALSEDELIAHLLLLHGLHPVALERRVIDALDAVRPYLESHGGNVELVAIEGPAVRVRLRGSCSGCPSSTMTLKLAIENSIHKAAPEIEEVIADGEAAAPSLLQIEVPDDPWTMVGGLRELASSPLAVKQVGGRPVLFLELAGQYYGYRPRCPGCEGSLAEARLRGAQLTCTKCGNRYDALRAGSCLDSPDLHLEPVPLLVGEDGLVKVALTAA
jgi:Fe-S cluster biogenesis protein NfuA/nitrite reductase/ring-hydroxylating ferredoxin subunit